MVDDFSGGGDVSEPRRRGGDLPPGGMAWGTRAAIFTDFHTLLQDLPTLFDGFPTTMGT